MAAWLKCLKNLATALISHRIATSTFPTAVAWDNLKLDWRMRETFAAKDRFLCLVCEQEYFVNDFALLRASSALVLAQWQLGLIVYSHMDATLSGGICMHDATLSGGI